MSAEAQKTEYLCEVKEVFSGDDLVVYVDLGVEGLLRRQRIRLSGVDTPNAISASPNTEAGSIRREIRMLARHKPGKLTVINRNANSWVVVLVVDTPMGPINVNEMLIARGYEYKQTKR